MKKVILKTALVLIPALIVMFQGCKKDNPTPSPSIAAFAPASGLAGATVVIGGSNFGATTDKNVVTFAGTAATVTAASATSLTVTVPNGAASGKISVTVGSNSATSATDFTVLMAPTITSFTPASALVGAIVTITGANFDATPANNTVKFNGTTATVTTANANTLTVTVPAGATNGKITVTTTSGTATSASDFTVIIPPAITLSTASGAIGKAITITGNFSFSTTPANNVVKFNNTTAVVTAATATQLTVEVPYGATNGPVSVAVNGGNAVSSLLDFIIVSAWTQKTDYPGGALNSAVAFVIGNYAYVGGGFKSGYNLNFTFYKFDPTGAGTWTLEPSQPAATELVMSGFSIGDKGYAVDGANRYIYQYASSTKTWTKMIDSGQSGNIWSYESTFASGGKGYIKDEQGNLIEFDPAANGGVGSVTTAQAYPLIGPSQAQASFVIGGVAYMGGGEYNSNGVSNFYKYTNGAWTALNNLPQTGQLSAFSIGQYGYVMDAANKVWRYNPANDSWTQLEDFPDVVVQDYRPAFAIGQKGYISTGGGSPAGIASFIHSVTTWEYDPSK